MMGLLLWIWIGFPGTNNRTKLKRSVLILAGFMPIIATITIRNYVVGKDFVLLTSNGGINFYIGNNPRATGSFAVCKFEIWGSDLDYYRRDIKRTANDATPSEMSRIIAKEAWKFIREQPLVETRLLARKFVMLFNAFEISVNDNFYFARRYSRILSWSFIGFGIIGPIGLLGLFYQLKQWRKYSILLVFIAAQTGAFTIMFILSRFRLVFVACLILFAAKQLTWWWDRLQEKQYRRLVFSLIPLAICVLWVHYPLKGFDKTRGFGQQHTSVAKAYLASGETENAITEFQKALQSNFDPWVNSVRRANCYLSLGNLYVHQQQWPQAILIYEGLLTQYQQRESTPKTQAAIRQIQQNLDLYKNRKARQE
jgi:tetratricopeptide (TPR) repeat protein